MIGDPNVGKTTICNALLNMEFTKDYKPTIGASLMKIPFNYGGKMIWYYIWDTAGMERYKALAPVYYRGSKAAIITFDLTSRTSFDNVVSWINLYHENAGNNPLLILGNKSDLIDHRCIDHSEAIALADKYNAKYVEVSAFSKSNLGEILSSLSNMVDLLIIEHNSNTNQIKSSADTSCC